MAAACAARTTSGPDVVGSHTAAASPIPVPSQEIGDHSTASKPSAGAVAADSCAADTGRITSDRTDNIGSPAPSVRSTDTAPAPAGAIRTRARVAPAACSATPCHENGNTVWACAPASPAATPIACSAASSSTGCTPNPPACTPASSGTATSAKISAPRRHTACRPWNARPYW